MLFRLNNRQIMFFNLSFFGLLLLEFFNEVTSVNRRDDLSHRRSASQDSNGSIDWDSFSFLPDLTPTDHQEIMSPNLPFQDQKSSDATFPSFSSTLMANEVSKMPKEEVKRLRKSENHRRYKARLRLDPKAFKKHEERPEKMQHDEQEHKRKLNRAHVLKFNRKIREQPGVIHSSTHHRRFLLNKVENGTATQQDILKIQKMRERDRNYSKARREAQKRQKANYSSTLAIEKTP